MCLKNLFPDFENFGIVLCLSPKRSIKLHSSSEMLGFLQAENPAQYLVPFTLPFLVLGLHKMAFVVAIQIYQMEQIANARLKCLLLKFALETVNWAGIFSASSCQRCREMAHLLHFHNSLDPRVRFTQSEYK